MSIYDALKRDHEKVLEELDRLASISDPSPERSELIRQIRDDLIPHARAEEAVLYNSMRSLEGGKKAIQHAYGEHVEAEAKLRALQAKDKLNMDCRELARDLRSALAHHIHEEEGPIFSIAQQLFTKQEADMMEQAFEQLKPEIKEEGLLQTSLELVTNLMPKRFVPALRSINLDSRLS